MMSLSRQFLFIHVPKTAGNSLQSHLLGFSEDRMQLSAPYHDGVERFEIQSAIPDIHKHSTLEDYHARLAPEVFRSLFKFHCVRNPWDRCVSHFFSPHRGPVSFDAAEFHAFIESSVHPVSTYVALPGDPDGPLSHMDASIRFENLAEDFASVCDRLGLPRLDLPHRNRSNRRTVADCYGAEETVDLVRTKFALEIKLFDYPDGPV